MPDKVLLLGNGINRCFGVESWRDAIKRILEKYSTDLTYDQIKNLPYNMQAVVASGDRVDDAMKAYCDDLCKGEICEEQKLLLNDLVFGFDNILTTNYSFEIEQALGINGSSNVYRKISHQTINNLTRSQKQFNIYKNHETGGKRIWHVHGDAAAPSSVVMGHYYYGKLIHSVRNRIPVFISGYKSSRSRDVLYEPKSWVDLFLSSDVTVLGCSLDLCEYDLYHLLCCKKRHFKDTTVMFIVPGFEKPDPEKELILKTYNVSIIRINAKEKDYQSFYYNAVAYINNNQLNKMGEK